MIKDIPKFTIIIYAITALMVISAFLIAFFTHRGWFQNDAVGNQNIQNRDNYVFEDIHARGNVVLGNSATDILILNSLVNSDLLPDITSGVSYDIGSQGKPWEKIFVHNVVSNGVGRFEAGNGLSQNIINNTTTLSVRAGNGITVNNTGGVSIKLREKSGLSFSSNGGLSVKLSKGLSFDNDGKLSVLLGNGLSFDADGGLSVVLGNGLKLENNTIELEDSLDITGGLSVSQGLSVYGFSILNRKAIVDIIANDNAFNRYHGRQLTRNDSGILFALTHDAPFDIPLPEPGMSFLLPSSVDNKGLNYEFFWKSGVSTTGYENIIKRMFSLSISQASDKLRGLITIDEAGTSTSYKISSGTFNPVGLSISGSIHTGSNLNCYSSGNQWNLTGNIIIDKSVREPSLGISFFSGYTGLRDTFYGFYS